MFLKLIPNTLILVTCRCIYWDGRVCIYFCNEGIDKKSRNTVRYQLFSINCFDLLQSASDASLGRITIRRIQIVLVTVGATCGAGVRSRRRSLSVNMCYSRSWRNELRRHTCLYLRLNLSHRWVMALIKDNGMIELSFTQYFSQK